MSRKPLIYGGIILIAAVVIPILIKTARSASGEKGTSKNTFGLQNKTKCKTITASCKRCKRQSNPGSEYCWQHQDLN